MQTKVTGSEMGLGCCKSSLSPAALGRMPSENEKYYVNTAPGEKKHNVGSGSKCTILSSVVKE